MEKSKIYAMLDRAEAAADIAAEKVIENYDMMFKAVEDYNVGADGDDARRMLEIDVNYYRRQIDHFKSIIYQSLLAQNIAEAMLTDENIDVRCVLNTEVNLDE